MKRFLGFFLAFAMLVGFATTADAGWNIVQRADGTTVWQNGDGETTPIGGGVYTIAFSDFSTAITKYVAVHRDGHVDKIYAVSGSPEAGATGVDSTFTVYIGQTSGAANSGQFKLISGFSVTLAGLSDAGTNESDTISGPDDSVTLIESGGVVAVHSDGASVGQTPATITIIIN